jgi:hypothetical protein
MIRDHRKPQCASAHGANALLLAMISGRLPGIKSLLPVQLRCSPVNYAATRFPLTAWRHRLKTWGQIRLGELISLLTVSTGDRGPSAKPLAS